MRKYFFLFLLFSIFGCESLMIRPQTARQKQINTYNNVLAEHLHQKHLSSVESVAVWENPYGPGVILQTRHYEIYATMVNRITLYQIPQFLESAYNAYNSQLPEFIETSRKFRVYLFANRDQWEDFTNSFTGKQAGIFNKIKTGAYCYNGVCVAYDIGDERTFYTLGHEGWHQFSDRLFAYRLPSWLDEGLAMLFEAHSTRNGIMYFVPGENNYRIEALKSTLSNSAMIPLKELVAINPGQVLASNETEDVMAFYSQSYALVRFLREAEEGKRMDIYQRLIADGLYGNWPLSPADKETAIDRNLPKTINWNRNVGTLLFQEYINVDFEQIEWEYLYFCREITDYN